MHQFIELFVGALHLDEKSYLLDVFSGTAPFTKDSLKKLAAAGAYFFDHVYSQVAVLPKIQTTTKQNLVAANDAFCEIYDQIPQYLPDDSTLLDRVDHCPQRHWNNKGNSMEALALLLAEDGHHVLIWTMAWMCVQISYTGQSYAFVSPYVFSCPRWISMADHHCAPVPVASFEQLELHQYGHLQSLDHSQICEWKHLRMETFTIAFPAGLCPLDWQQGDCLLHHLQAPSHLAAPSTLRGEAQIYEWKHLQLKKFTIAFLAEINSLDWQCTQRLYKAARSSSIVGDSFQVDNVSLSLFQHTCKLFCNNYTYAKALFCKFCLSESRLQRWPTLHRHKVKFTSNQGLNQLSHA